MTQLNNKYTSSDIQSLSERDHIRLRTDVFLGSMVPETYTMLDLTSAEFTTQTVTFVPAVFKAVGEIIENSLDEFMQLQSTNKVLTFNTPSNSSSSYTVADTGRGVPIDMHSTGIPTPQVVYGQMRSGRNFKDDQRIKGTKGVNGVGSCCTAACSTTFNVDINRDGKAYHQEFSQGLLDISKPTIKRDKKSHSGTSVTFALDPAVFSYQEIPDNVWMNRALEIAYTNPGVSVLFNGAEIEATKTGFTSYLDATGLPYVSSSISCDEVAGEAYVVMLPPGHSMGDKSFLWADGSYIFDGGLCNTQFMNALTDSIQSLYEQKNKKITVPPTAAFRERFAVLLNLKLASPKYDSQAKIRLTGPNLRVQFNTMASAIVKSITVKQKQWIQEALTYWVDVATHAENKSAQKEFEKKKKKILPPETLLEATGKKRSLCQVIVTEGLSAKASISEARNPTTTAAYALTGKINNVYGKNAAALIQMPKVAELVSVVGLVPGKKADRSQLNYGRVLIATDSDVDGGDIFCLLINMFYQFWPELLDPNEEPFIYRLVAPNVCVTKGKERIHFASLKDFEKVKKQYNKGYAISYYKGLGSMDKADWIMVLQNDDTLVPVINDDNLQEALQLLFSDDAEARRAWLSDQSVAKEESSVDYLIQQRREYSLYTLMSRALPAASDGLKPAGRRAIWKAKDGKKIKTASLAGSCMSLHPHGENSGAINTLTAYYGMNYPLFKGHGSFGTLLDTTAYGAARYTAVELSAFAKDVLLVDMDLIPMVDNYDCSELEPGHFLPLIPLTVVNPIEGVAVGYAATILPRKLEDVIAAQIAVLKHAKAIPPCVPYFAPTDSTAYKVEHINGKPVFYFKGKWSRIDRKHIEVTALPYGMSHYSFIATLASALEKDVSWLTGWEDHSKDVMRVVVTLSADFTDEQIDSLVSLNARHSENFNVLHFTGDRVWCTSAEQLIVEFTKWRLSWYAARYQHMIDQLAARIQKHKDVEIAIENHVNETARKAKSKNSIRQLVEALQIVNIDYIVDLPVYRFTQDARAENLKEMKAAEAAMAKLQAIISSPSKLEKAYVDDLNQILDAASKGKYNLSSED